MEKLLIAVNALGLFINFIGAVIMVNGTPVTVGAVIYADGGEMLRKKYKRQIKTGMVLFCIGFFIQFTVCLLSLI